MNINGRIVPVEFATWRAYDAPTPQVRIGGAEMRLIFVYGTLLSGEANAMIFRPQDRLLGRATTRGRIFNYGFAPGAVPSDDPADVLHGEVYEVTPQTLSRLDMLEGVDHQVPRHGNYRREEIEAVLMDTGEIIRPEVYWHNHSPNPRGQHIPSGDWRQR